MKIHSNILKCESCRRLITKTTHAPAQFLTYQCTKLNLNFGVRSDAIKKIGEVCPNFEAKNLQSLQK